MKLFLYVATAIASFLAFLVVFAPASLVWSLISEEVVNRLPDLQVHQISGTIWDGESEIQFRQLPSSALTWQLSPLALASATARIHITVQGQGHSLQGQITLDRTSVTLQALNGQINSGYINALSEPFGLAFAGDLEIRDLGVNVERQEITSSHGTVHWTGGDIVLNASTQPETISLPPLDGELYFMNQQIILDVTYQHLMLLQILLKKDGWAEVAVRGRLLDMANIPLAEGSDPDETILLLEEKIL